jgi:hypothetical protein
MGVLTEPVRKVCASASSRRSRDILVWSGNCARRSEAQSQNCSPNDREDLEAAFNRQFGEPAQIYRNGHRYFPALKWLSRTAVLFEIRAHDAAPADASEQKFVFNLDGTVQRE